MREDWKHTTLKEVTLSKNNIKWDSTQISREYIDLSSVDRDTLQILETSTINSKNAPSRAKQIVHKDDVLFGTTRPQLRRVTIVPAEYHEQICSTGFSILRSNPERILSEYIFYLLQSEEFMDEMSQLERGTSYPAVTDKDVKGFQFFLPPLPEQKRIVAILDEAFEAIDQAKANIERNIQNAEELFQSKLNEVFSKRGEEWEEKTLEQIALEFGRGKSKHRPRNDEKLFGGNYPFIQTGDVRKASKYITNHSQTYNEIGLKQSKLWPQGTVCITIAANIAESAILDFEGCFPDSIIGAYVDPNKAFNSYVYYCLQYFKAELQAQGKGSAQDNINLGTFKERYFPFPDKLTQKKIANELDYLYEIKKDLIEQYQIQLKNLVDLKKSILQKAFSGELTANEHVVA